MAMATLGHGAQTAADPRRMPDMEQLSERLGSNLRTLIETNDRLEQGLNGFQQVPTAMLAANLKEQMPEGPPPGTLAYLEYVTKRTNEELGRHSDLVNRVRTIF